MSSKSVQTVARCAAGGKCNVNFYGKGNTMWITSFPEQDKTWILDFLWGYSRSVMLFRLGIRKRVITEVSFYLVSNRNVGVQPWGIVGEGQTRHQNMKGGGKIWEETGVLII